MWGINPSSPNLTHAAAVSQAVKRSTTTQRCTLLHRIARVTLRSHRNGVLWHGPLTSELPSPLDFRRGDLKLPRPGPFNFGSNIGERVGIVPSGGLEPLISGGTRVVEFGCSHRGGARCDGDTEGHEKSQFEGQLGHGSVLRSGSR